jgi:putative ABC transport system ATP-binding protein
MNEIIRLENVVYMTQGNWRAVNDISFSIQENERVLVCGGSGSGKDALMRLIAGMDKPSSGSVWVLNKAVHEMNCAKAAVFRNKNIGVLQREAGFMEKLSVAENISLPLVIRGARRDQRNKETDKMLGLLEIRHVAQANPAQLSAYEARVACLARALITKPKILLLNEFASCLSVRDSEKMTETINAIAHNSDFAMLCFNDSVNNTLNTNRTIQMENGKIREDRK